MTQSSWQQVFFKDDNFVTVTIVIFVAALFGIYRRLKARRKHQLPGPWGLPIVGFLPFVGPKPPIMFHNLQKKYGPVFQVQLGSLPCLVLGSFEAVKEAFIKQSEIFSGRPNEISFKIYSDEPAFIFDDGESFKDVRSFSMDRLKKLGFGRLSLEPLVKLEVDYLEQHLKNLNGMSIDPTNFMEKSIGNAVCSVLTGKREETENLWLKRLIAAVDGLQLTYIHDIAFYYPWMNKFPIIKHFTTAKEKDHFKQEFWNVIQEKIDIVKRETEEGLRPENFISQWFKEYDKRKGANDETFERYNNLNLKNNLDIFIQASFETTSTTVMWAYVRFIKHPDAVEKIRQEINAFAKERGPDLSFADAKYLHYTRAFIQELHRCSSIVPLGVFHNTMNETMLMGYHVPKRILTMANSYAVHHDPELFPDPLSFKPERFINEKGEFVRSEAVIPFSIGKRFCPGEYVAQMELFHYITRVAMKFDLRLDSDPKDFGKSTENTLITHPLPFKITFIPRDDVDVVK